MAGQRKNKGPGIKKIKKSLSDCALDPNELGWFKIVADAPNDYLIRRSGELLRELLTGAEDAKLHQAIALLGLVKARFDERVQSSGK